MRKNLTSDRRKRIKHIAVEIVQAAVAIDHADQPRLRVIRDFFWIRENAQPATRPQPAVANQFSRHRRHRAWRHCKPPRQFSHRWQPHGRIARPIDFTDKIMSDLQCLLHIPPVIEDAMDNGRKCSKLPLRRPVGTIPPVLHGRFPPNAFRVDYPR